MLRLAAIIVAAGVLALLALPFAVAAVLAGQLQQVTQLAAQWDIPPEIVPALQNAGQQAGIPWFLLAGVASVATDFARHGPDGLSRGDTVGTTIFPVVTPPIGRVGASQGMFLLNGRKAVAAVASPLGDPQNVRDAANWLAGQLAALSQGSPLSQSPLGDPGVSHFWQAILAAAPLAIAAPAPTTGADSSPGSAGLPGSPGSAGSAGSNPIQQFGSAVLSHIGAPITAGNLGAFSAWAAGEGTCAHFNPLATTQPEPGATPFNTLSGGGHVWNYPSFDTGVQATTTALTNGLYRQVIAAFQADAGVAVVAAAVERSPWGTHRFGSPTYAGRACGEGGGDGPGPGTAPATLPTVTGPAAVPATIVARAITYQSIWSQMVALAQSSTTSTP